MPKFAKKAHVDVQYDVLRHQASAEARSQQEQETKCDRG
jgi:hypothetical protein